MAEPDPLAQMRAHLDEAHATADRLVREAQRQAEDAAQVPPRGWEAPRAERGAAPDLQALLGLLDAARQAVPPELTRPLVEALRDLLLALRAIIDWYLERLGAPADRRRPVEVEDIPLD